MKPLIAFVMLVSSFSSIASAHHISVYADQVGAQCHLRNPVTPPGANNFYVIHKYNPGSTASQFRVADTTGLFFIQFTTPFLMLGTWDADLSLAYGGCVVGDAALGTLMFLWFGTPIPTGCANTLEILPAPTSPLPGYIALVDCATPSGNLLPASGGRAYFSAAECGFECQKLAVEATTWGGVKALYR